MVSEDPKSSCRRIYCITSTVIEYCLEGKHLQLSQLQKKIQSTPYLLLRQSWTHRRTVGFVSSGHRITGETSVNRLLYVKFWCFRLVVKEAMAGSKSVKMRFYWYFYIVQFEIDEDKRKMYRLHQLPII